MTSDHGLCQNLVTPSFTKQGGYRRISNGSWHLSRLPAFTVLFVLCIKRLGHIINEFVQDRNWKPIRISRDSPKVSHLMFADEILLIAEALVGQMQVIMVPLDKYCMASIRMLVPLRQ